MSLTSYRAAPPRERFGAGKFRAGSLSSNRHNGCEGPDSKKLSYCSQILVNHPMDHKEDTPPDIAARTLASLLRDLVASGRRPIETPDISDAIAVHDLRKELKRWRAILRLIAPMVGDEAELMRVKARDVAREMATARDGRAVQEALADLGNGSPDLPTRSRAAVAERLARIGASAEAASLTPTRK